MTAEEPQSIAPIVSGGYTLDQEILTFKGHTHRVRELTVEENDACRDLAVDKDGNFDGTKMMRLMVSTATSIELEELGKLPAKVYARMWRVVNDLNDPDASEDKPGND